MKSRICYKTIESNIAHAEPIKESAIWEFLVGDEEVVVLVAEVNIIVLEAVISGAWQYALGIFVGVLGSLTQTRGAVQGANFMFCPKQRSPNWPPIWAVTKEIDEMKIANIYD